MDYERNPRGSPQDIDREANIRAPSIHTPGIHANDAPHPPAGTQHRYVALDSLRGVCACMVVLLHVKTQGFISSLPLVQHGDLFVDFFFVLSGFVIASSYGARLAGGFPLGRFMGLRLARIYPLHLAMLLAFLAFEVFFALFMPGLGQRQPFEGSFSPTSLVQSLLLIQIFPGLDALAWNMPSWSIAAEIWTYLLFAALFCYARRWLIATCLMIAVAAPLALATQSNHYLMYEGALLRCLFGFALGVLGWRCANWVSALNVPRSMDHFSEVAAVAGVLAFVSHFGGHALSLMAPYLFLAAVLIFSRERGLVSGLLRRGPFLVVGALSYSIYMIHIFLYYRLLNGFSLVEKRTGLDLVAAQHGSNSIGGGPWFGDAVSILFLALVILCAYASYRLIEMPGQRWARKLLRDRPVAVSTEVGAP